MGVGVTIDGVCEKMGYFVLKCTVDVQFFFLLKSLVVSNKISNMTLYIMKTFHREHRCNKNHSPGVKELYHHCVLFLLPLSNI